MRHLLLTLLASTFSALVAVALYASLRPASQPSGSSSRQVRQVEWMEPPIAPVLRSASVPQINSAGAPATFTAAAARATPAVVNIRAYPRRAFDFFGGYGGATGSGVIISPDGYIVTNHHVVEEGPNNVEVTLADQREYRAQLVGTDPTTDLALVKIEVDEPLPYVRFANSDSVLVGEWVLAVGNPFNLESTVTAGIVSAKGRNIDILEGEYKIESFIQTDAAVNPGNSGGALVNTAGHLIGVNTAIITRSGRYEGYSFAVPSNLARKVVSDLREFGSVKRAILGVRISEVNAAAARRLGLEAPSGVLIQDVTPGGSADMAGLKSGDVITGINDQAITSIPELQEYVARYRPGNVVAISFYRKGRLKSVQAVLKSLDGAAEESGIADRDPQSIFDTRLGWEYRNLSLKEQQRLGTQGVFVDAVAPDGPLATTRMERGFVVLSVHRLNPRAERIVRMESRPIRSVGDLQEALRDFQGEKVLFEGRYEGYDDDWGYTLVLDGDF